MKPFIYVAFANTVAVANICFAVMHLAQNNFLFFVVSAGLAGIAMAIPQCMIVEEDDAVHNSE